MSCGTGRKDLACQKMKSKRPLKESALESRMSSVRSVFYTPNIRDAEVTAIQENWGPPSGGMAAPFTCPDSCWARDRTSGEKVLAARSSAAVTPCFSHSFCGRPIPCPAHFACYGAPRREKPSRSDPVPQPTTAGQAVADLHALLKAAGQARPLILVGHSYGGLVVRLYASTYPDDAA
jgi:Alpha/beta hydrolase family